MEKERNTDVFIVAFGKGKIKKWTLERIIIDTLYKTADDDIQYIKVNDINCFGEPDDEIDGRLIYRYGYNFRVPKTEIDLIVNKKDGRLILEKVGLGYGYDDVEEALYQDIEKQIKNKHLYFKTSFNNEEFLIY